MILDKKVTVNVNSDQWEEMKSLVPNVSEFLFDVFDLMIENPINCEGYLKIKDIEKETVIDKKRWFRNIMLSMVNESTIKQSLSEEHKRTLRNMYAANGVVGMNQIDVIADMHDLSAFDIISFCEVEGIDVSPSFEPPHVGCKSRGVNFSKV